MWVFHGLDTDLRTSCCNRGHDPLPLVVVHCGSLSRWVFQHCVELKAICFLPPHVELVRKCGTRARPSHHTLCSVGYAREDVGIGRTHSHALPSMAGGMCCKPESVTTNLAVPLSSEADQYPCVSHIEVDQAGLEIAAEPLHWSSTIKTPGAELKTWAQCRPPVVDLKRRLHTAQAKRTTPQKREHRSSSADCSQSLYAWWLLKLWSCKPCDGRPGHGTWTPGAETFSSWFLLFPVRTRRVACGDVAPDVWWHTMHWN